MFSHVSVVEFVALELPMLCSLYSSAIHKGVFVLSMKMLSRSGLYVDLREGGQMDGRLTLTTLPKDSANVSG
ncbi:hypothetical protein F2Q69_00042100 [Brassica cretica]|uniref:Uncharacterized protein n=1 Tax=Brassica cretica TaxID=69181 RepID=A0A8S9NJT6_BRACR|nr:hypothetical protein F2Q69_00042100 [Brassica cretica]